MEFRKREGNAPKIGRVSPVVRSKVSCFLSPRKDSTHMRMLLNISIPHEPFNTAVKDGTAGQKLGRIVDEIKAEAVYFTEQHGQRGAVMIVEMSDASKIPALAEPWFLTFNANVEFRVVMTPDDLQKAGLDGIGKKWGSVKKPAPATQSQFR